MKNSADLRGCYPPQPLASVDNTLLDLKNSSYPTQPHSVIAKYQKLICRSLWYLNTLCVVPEHVHPSPIDSEGIFLPLRKLGRCSGLMVSALNSGVSSPGSSPGWEHCVVFSGKILYSDTWHLCPHRCINGYLRV